MTAALPRGLSLRRLLLAALAAGIAGGMIAAFLQQLFLVPLILQAETFEVGADLHAATDSGLLRTAYTFLFDCIGAFGFALLLAGCYSLRGGVTWQQGLIWGLAGFASFSLAPALGLPPELPGMAAADLTVRQMWWILTVTTTAAGLACAVFSRVALLRMLGLVLIVLPHVAGAPHLAVETHGDVPEAMVRTFVIGSLGVSAVMWLILGAATAAFMRIEAPRT